MGCTHSDLRKDGAKEVAKPVSVAPTSVEPVPASVEPVPEVPPEPTWNGAYLCYKAEAMGTLYLLWSKTNPQGSMPEGHKILLYVEPGKSIPEHRYKHNLGRVELSKNVDNKKTFFQQLASALQQVLMNCQATQLHLVEQAPHAEFRVCFLYHRTNVVTKLTGPGDVNYELSPDQLNAVAVISFHEACLDVQKLAEPLFMQVSQKAGGHSVKLRKSEFPDGAPTSGMTDARRASISPRVAALAALTDSPRSNTTAATAATATSSDSAEVEKTAEAE